MCIRRASSTPTIRHREHQFRLPAKWERMKGLPGGVSRLHLVLVSWKTAIAICSMVLEIYLQHWDIEMVIWGDGQSQMLHGAGIFTYMWDIYVVNEAQYSSTMEHMGFRPWPIYLMDLNGLHVLLSISQEPWWWSDRIMNHQAVGLNMNHIAVSCCFKSILMVLSNFLLRVILHHIYIYIKIYTWCLS